ncbi:hypothetical protein HanPSC8_Chr01g0044271 [Helianthus annuus]|nr:hypothetical protein HanPSC8_Chr01g0044271 [Helianthus annuus]
MDRKCNSNGCVMTRFKWVKMFGKYDVVMVYVKTSYEWVVLMECILESHIVEPCERVELMEKVRKLDGSWIKS